MAPKFSIIVPTRNRSATLRHTLRTCLDQTFGDFEVVVTDNFSDDDTREVVAALDDPRIKYVRTSSYISMSRNFANGLKHASGEALIFIGDDDGMLPYGLELLDRILTADPDVDAVRWHPPFFWWPGGPEFELRAPTSDFARKRTLELPGDIWPRVTHPNVLSFFEMTGFTVYHGCWRRRVVERAQADSIDIFDGPIPDVLASIYGLRYAQACLVIETPVSIMGVSKKSNGWAQSAVKPTEDQKEIRDDFSARSAIDFPNTPPITYIYCQIAPYYGSLLQYWVRAYGSLADFDHEAWRMLWLDQAVTLYPDDSAALCASYNKYLSWLVGHGARDAREITEEERLAYHENPVVKPTAPASDPRAGLWEALTAARQDPGGVDIRRAVLYRSMFYVTARARQGEFTIADFATLYAGLLGAPRSELAVRAATDAAGLQQATLASLTGRCLPPAQAWRFLRRIAA